MTYITVVAAGLRPFIAGEGEAAVTSLVEDGGIEDRNSCVYGGAVNCGHRDTSDYDGKDEKRA